MRIPSPWRVLRWPALFLVTVVLTWLLSGGPLMWLIMHIVLNWRH